MNSRLIKFHKDCKDEFHEILKDYNIIFYGYGNKEELLEDLFPEAIIVNCVFMDTKDIIEAIRTFIIENEVPRNLKSKFKKYKDIDFFYKFNLKLVSNKENIIIVLINFNRELNCLNNHSNIKLIGTIECVENNLTFKDIEDYNFIFRDLTTFLPYKKEILDVNIKEEKDKLKTANNVLSNVSKKSNKMFLMLLKKFGDKNTVSFEDLKSSIGKTFLLRKVSEIILLLGEFFDHDLLKKDDDQIHILIKKKDIEAILNKWK